METGNISPSAVTEHGIYGQEKEEVFKKIKKRNKEQFIKVSQSQSEAKFCVYFEWTDLVLFCVFFLLALVCK